MILLLSIINENRDFMEAYTGFAQVYDVFMDNVPYEEWRDRLLEILRQENISDGLLLELGCGTGRMTRMLAEVGYDMIGVDASEEMLMLARENSAEYPEILYLLQDMREFELYGTVRGVISICDSMNYILHEQELLQVFRLVNNYLDPRGVFVFDMNTRYKYEKMLADNTFCENRSEGSFIWENYYDPQTCENEYDLTLFIRQKEGHYRKYEETHVQRAYEPDTIKQLLMEAGLTFVAATDEQGGPVTDTTERMYILARECQK